MKIWNKEIWMAKNHDTDKYLSLKKQNLFHLEQVNGSALCAIAIEQLPKLFT